MRQVFTLLLVFAFTAAISAQNWGNRNRVKGNGDTTTQERKVSSFSGIQTCCSFNVEVRKGAPGVRVEAESNLQEYIKTEVSGGRLSIGFTNNTNISNHKPIRVYVTMNELDYVKASSSSKIEFKDAFSGDELEMHVSSSANIMGVEFSGKTIYLDASSSGKIELAGTGNRIRAKASSSGRIDASDCKVNNGRASVSSGANINLNVSGELDASASSGGTVRYKGSPSVDSDTSSGGSVRSGK
ncbi:head GIN domain-containing protein [Neolewinella persica]|uniref:head GIN domain-containing protein n=1 Tax=Neolewinella persica TaxID=70998 RepID=UPI000363ABCD|nr:head GIN domain-containing protein [Neolewinella persica]